MRPTRLLGAMARILLVFVLTACSNAALVNNNIPITSKTSAQQPQYVSPLPNARLVSTAAAIAVRYGPELTSQELARLEFTVQGDQSGRHTGQPILADDRKTIIYQPEQPFSPGEQVRVALNALQLDQEHSFRPLAYYFTVAANQQPGGVGAAGKPLGYTPRGAFPSYLTIPHDIPNFTVQYDAAQTAGEGYVFVAPIPWTSASTGSYLLILDGAGDLVYYKSMEESLNGFDFKVQPTGTLTYFDQKDGVFYELDPHYQVINTYQTGNGYAADLHELLLLPNGHALLMSYDDETVNMREVQANGNPEATATGLIVQELDASKNVVFEWRSWDHIPYTDSVMDVSTERVDLVHGNAIAIANDGNLLISNRNLSEITKIDRQTGAVLWRLGGKGNQFTFLNDEPFAFQHDVRVLPNGNITLFDNAGHEGDPKPSRGLEYEIDEANHTVSKVWEYVATPPIFGMFMGNTQRLDNGNTLMNWGSPFVDPDYQYTQIVEVNPQNQVVFQLAFDQPFVSYRATRGQWQGAPVDQPTLAFARDQGALTLGYSWNGATGVALWRLYAGSSPETLEPLETRARSGFETQTRLSNPPTGKCYFQVAALNADDNELAHSAVISTDPTRCPLAP